MNDSQTVLRLLTATTLLVSLLSSPSIAVEPELTLPVRSIQTKQADGRLIEADHLFNQGLQAYNRGQFQEALTLWQQALEQYRAIGHRPGEVNTLNNLGYLYTQFSQYELALEVYEQQLVIAREMDNRSGEATALGNLGLTYRDLGDYSRAIDLLEQHLALAREMGDRAGESRALGNLGSVYTSLGDYPQALEFVESQLAIARTIGDRPGESRALGNLGNLYSNLSQYQPTIDAYTQQLTITREIGDRVGEGVTLGNLANAYGDLSQYQQAIELYQQALAIAREVGDRTGESIVLGNLGNTYEDIGQYEKALELTQQSLTLARDIGNRVVESNALLQVGSAYAQLGQLDRAIDLYQQGLALARDLRDRVGEGRALSQLSNAYKDLGHYELAIDLAEQQLALHQDLDNRAGESAALGTLGVIYRHLGQYERAIDLATQCLTISREVGNRTAEGGALNLLGTAYSLLGQHQRALDFYNQSLALSRSIGDRPGETSALNNLGLAYGFLNQHERSIDFFQNALTLSRSIGDRSSESSALSNLGFAYYRLEQYSQAIEFYETSLAIAQEIGDRAGAANALNNMGAAHLRLSNPDHAEAVLRQAVDLLTALRSPGLNDADKIAFSDTQIKTFRLLQRTLIAQGKVGAALEIAEQGRAQAFADLLTQQVSTPPTSTHLAAIQAFAQQHNLTLVEYSVIEFNDDPNPALYIWVISPDGSITFRQQSLVGIDLDALVRTTRQAIGVRGIRSLEIISAQATSPAALSDMQADANLTQLHHLLIAPIADRLPTDPEQPVVFIPQGELFLVPFPALRDRNGQYLIERHTLLTAPSIQVLQLTHTIGANTAEQSLGNNALIVGNPTMPTVTFLNQGNLQQTQLSPLPGAQQEAQAIASFFNTSAWVGNQASEAQVKQQITQATLIHLATHGLLEYGDPQETGSRETPGAIALAPGNGEDGLLTSNEILQMDLQAKLVVLSACDTGQGRITGDGVIGLSRAFVAVGVPSIIVSLWSVPDAPTASLMTEFYRQIHQGQSKAQALRQAMLSTKVQHPNPRDWAAFTLIGEDD